MAVDKMTCDRISGEAVAVSGAHRWRLGLHLLAAILATVAARAGETPPDPARLTKPDWCGLWGIRSRVEHISTEGRPWYKGVMVTSTWNRIQPEKDRFDWSSLDDRILAAVKNGLYVTFKIYHGNKTPDWVYASGVPNAYGTGDFKCPYYLDPDFKPLLDNLIEKMGDHVDAFPPHVRRRIIGVQVTAGKSGDMQPYYRTPPMPEYRIDGRGGQWGKWWRDVSMTYYRVFKDRKPPIFVISKGGVKMDDWLMKNMPGSGRKIPNVAQMCHLNGERQVEWFIQRHSRFNDGVATRVRGEVDYVASGKSPPWFKEAPVWNVYAHCLWMLTCGVDILNIQNGKQRLLLDERHVPGYVFFTKYAGYKDPRDSVGAWCALRDGLDAMDTERFPVKVYGPLAVPGSRPGHVNNKERFLKIAQAFSAYGARQDDPQVIIGVIKQLVRAKAMNDVGYRIWPGNYRMYLYQHDPNGTSQGYWRQGPKEEPYGRFARGFDHARGKDAMYFNIDDGFFFDEPLRGKYTVEVRVVYLDEGTGSWALKYDAADDPERTCFVVKKTDSGRWKERTATVVDGHFGNRCPNKTDLMLVNTDDEDDIFHMVEVTRRTGFRTGYFGETKD